MCVCLFFSDKNGLTVLHCRLTLTHDWILSCSVYIFELNIKEKKNTLQPSSPLFVSVEWFELEWSYKLHAAATIHIRTVVRL